MRNIKCTIALIYTVSVTCSIGLSGCTADEEPQGALPEDAEGAWEYQELGDTDEIVDSDTGDNSTDTSQNISPEEYCAVTADWDPSWAALEQDLADLINEQRALGANCGAEGEFPPMDVVLTMDEPMRCASRVHSKNMADQGFYDHVGPDGVEPRERLTLAGAELNGYGEYISAGIPTALELITSWMADEAMCSSILTPSFSKIGVGYYPGGEYMHYWTVTATSPTM